MLNVQTKLSGDFSADLDKFEAKIKAQVLRAGAGAMSNVIYQALKSNVSRHVVTGTMLNAVYQYHVVAQSDDNKQTYYVGINKKKAPHWHFLEYGTSRQPAYPVIRPAFDRVDGAINAGLARMAERMKEIT